MWIDIADCTLTWLTLINRIATLSFFFSFAYGDVGRGGPRNFIIPDGTFHFSRSPGTRGGDEGGRRLTFEKRRFIITFLRNLSERETKKCSSLMKYQRLLTAVSARHAASPLPPPPMDFDFRNAVSARPADLFHNEGCARVRRVVDVNGDRTGPVKICTAQFTRVQGENMYVCMYIYIYIYFFFIGKKSSVSENLFIVQLCSRRGGRNGRRL